jgi:hypothetical protein
MMLRLCFFFKHELISLCFQKLQNVEFPIMLEKLWKNLIKVLSR